MRISINASWKDAAGVAPERISTISGRKMMGVNLTPRRRSSVTERAVENVLAQMKHASEEQALRAMGPRGLLPEEIAQGRWRFLRRIVMPAVRWIVTQRNKYEKLQRELLKDAISRGVRFNRTDNSHHMREQGDEDMYTIESLIERAVLQKDTGIRDSIEQMWELPGMFKEGGVFLIMESYIEFNMALHKALVPDISYEEAMDAADQDWEKDSGGRDTMTHKQFNLAVFELADLWCHSIDAEEYVDFLGTLLRAITFQQEEGAEGADEQYEHSDDYQLAAQFGATSGLFRDFDDIECTLFDGMGDEEVEIVMNDLIDDHLDDHLGEDLTRSSQPRSRALSIPGRKRALSNAGLQRNSSIKGSSIKGLMLRQSSMNGISLLEQMSNSFRFERGWKTRLVGDESVESIRGADSPLDSQGVTSAGNRTRQNPAGDIDSLPGGRARSSTKSSTLAPAGSFRSVRAIIDSALADGTDSTDSIDGYGNGEDDDGEDDDGEDDDDAEGKYSNHPDAPVVRRVVRGAMKQAIGGMRRAITKGELSIQGCSDSADAAAGLVPTKSRPTSRRQSKVSAGSIPSTRPLARMNSCAGTKKITRSPRSPGSPGCSTRPLARVNTRGRSGSKSNMGLWHGLLQRQVSQRGEKMMAKMKAMQAKMARKKMGERSEGGGEGDARAAAKRAEMLMVKNTAVTILQANTRGQLVRADMRAEQRRLKLKRKREEKRAKKFEEKKKREAEGLRERRKSELMAANARYAENERQLKRAQVHGEAKDEREKEEKVLLEAQKKNLEAEKVRGEAAITLQSTARGHLARRSAVQSGKTVAIDGVVAEVPIALQKLARAKERARQRRQCLKEAKTVSIETPGQIDKMTTPGQIDKMTTGSTSLLQQVAQEKRKGSVDSRLAADLVVAAGAEGAGGAHAAIEAADTTGRGVDIAVEVDLKETTSLYPHVNDQMERRSSEEVMTIDAQPAAHTEKLTEHALVRTGMCNGMSDTRYASAVRGVEALESSLGGRVGDEAAAVASAEGGDPVTKQLLELVNGCWRQREMTAREMTADEAVFGIPGTATHRLAQSSSRDRDSVRGIEAQRRPAPPQATQATHTPSRANEMHRIRRVRAPSTNVSQKLQCRVHVPKQKIVNESARLLPLQPAHAPRSSDHPLLQQAQQQAVQQKYRRQHRRQHHQHRYQHIGIGQGVSAGKFKVVSPMHVQPLKQKVRPPEDLGMSVQKVQALQEWRPQRQLDGLGQEGLGQEVWHGYEMHGQLYCSVLHFKKVEPLRPKRTVAAQYKRSNKRLPPPTPPLSLPALMSATPPLPDVLRGEDEDLDVDKFLETLFM
jgi:hypothetical protein